MPSPQVSKSFLSTVQASPDPLTPSGSPSPNSHFSPSEAVFSSEPPAQV